MANGENLQSQNQELNNETSLNEVNNEQNLQDSNAEEHTEKPETPISENLSEVNSDVTPPPEEEVKEEVASVNSSEEPAEQPADDADAPEVQKSDEKGAEEEKSEAVPEEEKTDAPEKIEAETDSNKKEDNQEKFNELFNTLKTKKENNEIIKVKVLKKIRGGLRVLHENMPIFLPASHFTIKKSAQDEELNEVVGKEIDVHIHELSEEEETGRKTVIVTRKRILKESFWSSINVGDQVTGVVSSIAPFGVFLDLGGFEGLIHVSRLSQTHVDHPKNFCKKGDKMTAVIVEINKDKERIALSKQELEESPWKDIEEEFPKGTVVKGKVKRLTDFGAYIELKEGVDGLLRTNEISWTERIRKPGDILNAGDEIEVEVMSSNANKRTAALSYKRTQPNPWNDLKVKYPVDTELTGKVKQIVSQGAVITIDDNIDGFMPKSKIMNLDKGKKIPYNVDDEIKIKIADLVPENESLIFAPVYDEDELQEIKKRQAQFQSQPRKRQGGGAPSGRSKPPVQSSSDDDNAFTFMDLLSDREKSDLSKINK
jgi:small subunit ribosomal protein S1